MNFSTFSNSEWVDVKIAAKEAVYSSWLSLVFYVQMQQDLEASRGSNNVLEEIGREKDTEGN